MSPTPTVRRVEAGTADAPVRVWRLLAAGTVSSRGWRSLKAACWGVLSVAQGRLVFLWYSDLAADGEEAHIMGGNELYSRTPNLNVNLSWKYPHRNTWNNIWPNIWTPHKYYSRPEKNMSFLGLNLLLGAYFRANVELILLTWDEPKNKLNHKVTTFKDK